MRLEPIDIGAIFDQTADPLLVVSEWWTLLFCRARRPDGGTGTLRVRLKMLRQQFGHPNDEALAGHPLADAGLVPFTFFRVHGSAWLASVNEENRRAFPDWRGYEAEHLIVGFKEATFECLASAWEVEFQPVELRHAVRDTFLELGGE